MITIKHPALPRMATFLVFCTSLVACSGSSNNPETVPEPQLQPLAITATTPADGGTGVLNTVTVSATFDQPVNPATLGGGHFSVRCPSDAQPFGSVAYDAATRTATFIGVSSTPTNEAQSQIAEPLLANTTCVATISTGVRAVSGAALARNVVWSFSTVPDAAFLGQGKNTFRFETFGDESQWSDALRMHEVIGTAVDPTTALNPAAAAAVMCRHTLSVGWDGRLYDRDFNQMFDLTVDHGAPSHISDFDPAQLHHRRIVTHNHCYGCTAGSGSSCGGTVT